MQFDEAFIKQVSQTAAENIICCCRQSGWDALDYAQRQVESAIKRSIDAAVQKEQRMMDLEKL